MDENVMLALAMMVLYASAALVSLLFYKKHEICNVVSNLLNTAASAVGIGLSISGLLRGSEKVIISSISSNISYLSFTLYLDKLSSFFLLALSVLTLAVSIYSINYNSHYYHKKNVGVFNILYPVFILSMILVMTAGNTIGFLFFWEMMSLVSYFLVMFESEERETRKAGTIYLIMTHIGTAFLLIAFMLTFKYTHSFDIGVNMAALSGTAKSLVFILLLIGFGTKAGIVPLHIWLPYAHPAAPSNVSALMSGIMIKTAVYGILRFGFIPMTNKPMWWGVVILAVGAISTVLGVAYAFMEHNIKRLLAYSSIENIGIIFMGIGVSFMAYTSGNKVLCGLALMAALFHLFNHTLFKGALFLGAGSIHYATHTKDMEELGGLMKKMPYTGVFMLAASLAISALPPFNGFVGEWITYQSLFMGLSSGSAGTKLITMLAVAALAMGGAIAAACFVKVIGIAFLGLPRSEKAKTAKEVPVFMKTGVGLLTALCLICGIFPVLVLRLLDKVSTELIGFTALKQVQGGILLLNYPITIDQTEISPLMVLLAGAITTIVVFMLIKVFGGHRTERKYGTWDCGYPELTPRMQYSATGFSKPLRIVFRALYMPTRELKTEKGVTPYHHKAMKYSVSTQSLFEKYFYLPIIRFFTRFARKSRLTIQTGSVHAYLIYIFITLVLSLVYFSRY